MNLDHFALSHICDNCPKRVIFVILLMLCGIVVHADRLFYNKYYKLCMFVVLILLFLFFVFPA